jgi:hypothetical protein
MDWMFLINPPTNLDIPEPLRQQDMAAQLEVFGFVDHTHPAAAELRQNAVMRNGFADHALIFQAGLAAKSKAWSIASHSVILLPPQCAGCHLKIGSLTRAISSPLS